MSDFSTYAPPHTAGGLSGTAGHTQQGDVLMGVGSPWPLGAHLPTKAACLRRARCVHLQEGEDYVVFSAADEGPRCLCQDSSFCGVGDEGAGSDAVIFSILH